MKIALVLASPPGYSETFFNSLIKSLQSNGHEVILYTGYCNESYKFCKHMKHPRVYRNPLVQILVMLFRCLTLLINIKAVHAYFSHERKSGTSLKRIIEKIYLNSTLLRFKGDWIHFGFATMAINREFVPKAVGAKMAVSFRGYDINVFPLKNIGCYNLLWQHVDKVHSISNNLLEKAYCLGLNKKNKYQVIYPAVDMDNLSKLNAVQKSNKLKIVTIARFNWVKGLDLLTEVAYILKRKGVDYEWVLIGDGNSLQQERFLFDIQEKGLHNFLIHNGSCSHSETLEILKTSDVYVQTSLIEGFCNALLEAQALGIPCIAFNVGGIPENIENNISGWLIEPYNTQEMAEAIRDLFSRSLEDKKLLSQRAIDRVQSNFNLKKQQQAFNKFYRF